MKNSGLGLLFLCMMAGEVFSYAPTFPYPGGADSTNTTALHMSDPVFVAWADAYTNMMYGEGVEETWKTPAKALGMATGDVYDIVSLGRSGHITLMFPNGILDGEGHDFAVFENGVSDTFLELAWVEVSSDGINFVRFPNYSVMPGPVKAFESVFPEFVQGFAGKYRKEYGTPFDLSELHLVNDAIDSGSNSFTEAYINAFTTGYDALDFNSVQFVRVIDVVGDGDDYSAIGQTIYDPYATFDSVGFDLEAVGVIHPARTDAPLLSVGTTNEFLMLEYSFEYAAMSNDVVMASTNLLSWAPASPQLVMQQTNGLMITKTVQLLMDSSNRFYRVVFDEL